MRRNGLGMASVVLVVGVVVTATILGPGEARLFFAICAALAFVQALQASSVDPRDMASALLLAAVPVVSLAGEGSPSALMVPLGALLLAAGELNALAWSCRAPLPLPPPARRRLGESLLLVVGGMGGSALVYLARTLPLPGGTPAVALAALGLAVLAAGAFSPRAGEGKGRQAPRLPSP